MEYTKGLWRQGSLNDEPFARSCLSIYQEDGRRIADVSREGFIRIEEAEANAHLISKAPRMYELLTRLVGVEFDTEDDNYEQIQPILDETHELLNGG